MTNRFLVVSLFSLVFLGACNDPSASESAKTAGKATVDALTRVDKSRAPKACWTDAECAPDENCECIESTSGNCETAGICMPRDAGTGAKAAMEKRIAATAAAGPGASDGAETAIAIDSCRSMRDLSFIPPGQHPVSAQWSLENGQINDMVCLARTNTKQIRVLRWLNYPLPAGYYTLRVESGVDPTFRGCAQWTEFQGQRTCVASWVLHVMQKND